MSMKKETLINGILKVTKRLPSSYSGNPRYEVRIGDHGLFKTPVNAMIGYAITNFEGKPVNAMTRDYYGSPHLFNVEAI